MESRLTFIRVVERKIKGNRGIKVHRMGLYMCDCGNEVEVKMGHVNYGNRKTCGCGIGTIKTGGAIHGLRKHRLYKVWADIKNRCLNPRTPQYRYYGGCGVKICDEWKNNFKAFYDWCMEEGWDMSKEVDKDMKPLLAGIKHRIYSPEWCSIVTKGQNNKYRKSTKLITRNGETKCIVDWCKQYGISDATYRLRLKKGWSKEKSLTTPLIKQRKK